MFLIREPKAKRLGMSMVEISLVILLIMVAVPLPVFWMISSMTNRSATISCAEYAQKVINVFVENEVSEAFFRSVESSIKDKNDFGNEIKITITGEEVVFTEMIPEENSELYIRTFLSKNVVPGLTAKSESCKVTISYKQKEQ